MINALISDNGFALPKVANGIVAQASSSTSLSAAGAFVSWGLYGAYAGYPLVGSASSTSNHYSETLAAIAGAFLVGVAGARYLTNEVDKKLLQRAAGQAAAAAPDPTRAPRSPQRLPPRP